MNFKEPAQIDFSLVRGDSRVKRFDITLDGVALNVSAGTIDWKATNSATTIGPILGSVGGAGSNEVTITFTPTHTGTLGVYRYDLQQTDGTDRYTYAIGTLTISQDVNLT
jgi:hypothetical protein